MPRTSRSTSTWSRASSSALLGGCAAAAGHIGSRSAIREHAFLVVRPSVGVNGAAEGRFCLWPRTSSDESAEIKATFQRACRRPSQPGLLGAPQTRLWSEIRDPLDRHGTRAVKADTFPRYR